MFLAGTGPDLYLAVRDLTNGIKISQEFTRGAQLWQKTDDRQTDKQNGIPSRRTTVWKNTGNFFETQAIPLRFEGNSDPKNKV